MAWMQTLFETYEKCAGSSLPDANALLPIAHTTQQAHIEIVIDGRGVFRRAVVLAKENQQTLIPCTEKSGGRAGSMPATHPLCDNLQYVAKDFRAYGGTVTSGYAKIADAPHGDYLALFRKWAAFAPTQSKLRAILAYVTRGNVIGDLVAAGILPLAGSGGSSPKLLKEWNGQGAAPEIFRRLPNGQAPEDAFIRWRVESEKELATGTWEDVGLIRSWQEFYASQQSVVGLCHVNGRTTALAEQHPKKLRHTADRAKLISSNDTSGFTFLGRFTDAAQAAGVSFEVTQKAHSALRWLIGRKQAARNGDQVFVAWAVGGQSIPDPWADPMSYKSGYDLKTGDIGYWGNGDGRFLYPPRREAATNQPPCLDAPINSMRWENLRDGMEDYEYLWLLQEASQRELVWRGETDLLKQARALLQVPKEVSQDLTHFTTDPRLMLEHREHVARMIERLQQKR